MSGMLASWGPSVAFLVGMFPVAGFERRLAATKSMEKSAKELLSIVEAKGKVTDESLEFLTTGDWPDLPWETLMSL